MKFQRSKRFLAFPRCKDILRLPRSLKGVAYRFSLLLPIISLGKVIFRDEDLIELQEMFTKNLGGCSYTVNVTHPLIEGTWQDNKGNIVHDKHVQFVVYTTQTDESMTYFRDLQQRLENYAGQEKIIIEQTTVRLL